VAFGYQIVRDILRERKEYNKVKSWKTPLQRSYK
jgi:TPP-dependent 2-oxoacid decarboxylase